LPRAIYYSIPHTKVQRPLTVLADPSEVRIVDGAQVLVCLGSKKTAE
jgi:hypothetical protein